ncbi:carbohydrate ABC transporter permease [Herbiconiux daphne]|uniref:Sugar ABC transporter permease n=1 Tax=Herbiconiux daphne TaxID=2970914 RepID=A0ABT2H5I7_9MICO|nr:sugar ABC transporter permease [Herbiconiux daphne]MCS5735192.1 sugar ABC transporter permease [Herbiconiux daphne]
MTRAVAGPRRPEPSRSGRRGLSLAGRSRAEQLAFLVPAIVFFALCFVFPLGYGVYMSTTDFTTGTFFTGKAPFVGLDNFADIFASPLLGKAVLNTVVITVVSVVVELVVGFALALHFNRRFPGSRWLPMLLLIPWLLPAVVVGTIWKWLLSGDGAVNDILHTLGLPTNAWLADPTTALWAVVAVAIWSGLPYWVTILGAALKQVPDEQLEAAQLDGAGAWKRLLHIVVPAIWPVISVLVVMSVIYTLLIVDLVLVLTQGGPADNTVTLGLLSYRSAFQLFEFGNAGAYGIVLLVISLAFAAVYTWLSGRRERSER